MSCWIDGVLDQQEQKRFIQHMESCENCRMELRKYKEMVFMLRNMEEQPLPAGFHERLSSRLAEEIQSSSQLITKDDNHVKWIRWIGAVAAIFVLLFSFKALDSVDLLGGKQTRTEQSKADRMEAGSVMERSAQDSSFSITAAPEALEDIPDSQNDSFQAEARVQEKMETYDEGSQVMQGLAEDDSETINTNILELRTQDVCVTPSTIKMMAINYGIEVIKSNEDSVVLKITDSEQKKILYQELSKMGDVKDIGDEIDLGEVTIIIISE